MKSSDILLSLRNETLKVWRVDQTVCVKYEDAWVNDGVTMSSSFGRGRNFEEACDDYLSKIRGRRLTFDGYRHKNIKEVTVLG